MNSWILPNKFHSRHGFVGCILVAIIHLTVVNQPGWTADTKDLYFSAEAVYRSFKKNPNKQKYRDNWLECIDKYKEVYRADPDGPWAAAGLYMAGTLYYELYQRSFVAADKKEAIDHLQRIVSRFPRSGYYSRAKSKIRAIQGKRTNLKTSPKKKPPVKDTSKESITPKNRYYRAEACVQRFKKQPQKQKYRDQWLKCIGQFDQAYQAQPNGPWAAASLYRSGNLYEELYKWSRNSKDLQKAVDNYQRVIDGYPQSAYRVKAVAAVGHLNASAKNAGTVNIDAPAPDHPSSNPPNASKTANRKGRAIITGMRFWSNPSYTRLVIDTSREITFSYRLLRRDPSINKPQRLYVDLKNSRLGGSFPKIIPIDDDLLSHARAGQYSSDVVRVVADIKSLETFKVFSLKDPFRIVLDIRGGQNTASTQSSPTKPAPKITINPKSSTKSLAKQLRLGVSRIVIDPGHGGRDYGAPGCTRGVHEKKVVLQIAKRLARMLRSELKCDVILTRSGDRFLTLEERTAIANTKNADLFLSLHTNANKDRRAYGIETYFLNLATDDESIQVAAMENATSTKNISDLQTILNDLMQNAKVHESSRLAGHIQYSMVKHLRSKGYGRVKNKGVKQAPFYVLLGAEMPAVLIETSFISNKRECKRLTNPKYQKRICEGIMIGIKNYIKETHPTAFQPIPHSEEGGDKS